MDSQSQLDADGRAGADDALERILERGLLDRWYGVIPAHAVGTAPRTVRRLGADLALWRDGGGTITGVVNTYFPGSTNAAAGATSITVGAHAAGDANVAIATGDLLLVIQMQGATFNSTNSSSYGDGLGSGSGATSTTAGLYEYIVAQSALGTGGGTVTIKGTGAGNGLINAYTTGGNATFQVIRVPPYAAPAVGAGLVPLGWNGTAGGVLAIDVQNVLDGSGSTVRADGLGFRGGGARQLLGDATAGNGD